MKALTKWDYLVEEFLNNGSQVYEEDGISCFPSLLKNK